MAPLELGQKLMRKVAPKFAARRAVKRAQRAARHAERQRQPDEVAGEGFQQDEERSMLQGKKTWIGLGLMVVGLVLNVFNIGECTADAIAAATCVPADTILANLGEAADKLATGIGLVVATVGTVHKQIREKRLRAQIAK